jgi:ribosomal protein S10
MLQFKLRSLNQSCLKFYILFISSVCKLLNSRISVVHLPAAKRIITLLSSPHVNKKAREQFLVVTYSAVITVKTTFEPQLLKFILANKPKLIRMSLKYKGR